MEGGETVTYQWLKGGSPISGATSASYAPTIGTDGLTEGDWISVQFTVDGVAQTVPAARTLLFSAPTATGGLANQSFVRDSGAATLDASSDFTFAGTGTYSITPAVANVSIDSAGLITFDNNEIDPQTGTTVTVRLADANDSTRFAESSFSLDITLAPPTANIEINDFLYTPPTDGQGAILRVGFSHGGGDELVFDAASVNEPGIVNNGNLDTQTGGTNVLEYFRITDFQSEQDYVVTGLTSASDAADAFIIRINEVNNGGTSGIFTAITGVSGLDFTAPAFSAAEVGNVANTTVRVTATEALYGTTTAADWVLAGATITAASLTPGNDYVDLTLSAAASDSDDFSGDLDFTGTNITDVAGNAFPTFADQDVTNNVSPPASGFATASDLFETGTITSTEVSDTMDIGTPSADREVLFLVGMEGNNGKAAGFDFTVNGTSHEGGPNELASNFQSNATAIGFNVPVAAGTTATVGLTQGTSGSSTANTIIAIPHTGSVVDSVTDYEVLGDPLTQTITTASGGTLHILLFGRDESFDNGTITITDPSGATLETTIVAANDIQSGEHPSNTNSGRAYVKLENTSTGTTTINLATTATSPSRWNMIAVALDN
ncbi:MAG: hypothetical protein AAFY43_01745 [Pseudomonadota bacterium]